MSDEHTPEQDVHPAETAEVTATAASESSPEEQTAQGVALLDRPRLERPPLVPRWVPIAAACAVALVLVVGGVFAYAAASAQVDVPNITGLELGVARTRLSQSGLGVAVVEHRFSDEPADTILSQSPLQGSTLPRGESIRVVVSAGSEEFAMPDVVGNGLLLARGILDSKGLQIRIELQPSVEGSDTVLATSPSAGSLVRTGDVVRVTVATPGPSTTPFLPLDMQGVVIKVDPAPVPAGEVDAPLEVARRLRSLVEASGGAIIATRGLADTGTASAPEARAKRAKEGSATASVGLSVAPKGAAGLVAFAPVTGTPSIVLPSTRLASQITTSLVAAGLKARSSTTTTDAVLAATGSPWSRVQLGSWAAREDVASFRDPAWADSVARAIYRALADLYGKKNSTP